MTENPPINRHFRLISVNFKEAALDSPSFRASINHLDNQLLNISQWIPAVLSSMKKVPKKINELKAYLTSFIEQLSPGFVYDGVLDQEVTVPLLKQSLGVNKQLFNICMIFINYDSAPLMAFNKTFTKLYEEYLVLKAEFDTLQAKYDQYLSVYMASPKVKNSEMAIEDAIQLFNCRCDYLHASLNMVVKQTEISSVLDIEFISIVSNAWSDKVKADSSIGMLKAFERESFTILRSKSWSMAYSNAMRYLAEDVTSARTQVENSSIDLFEPSKHPDDYKSTLINNHTLDDIDEPAFEKHGYLLMKTWVTSSPKPIWVKRWVFIKSGLLGMLILSPSKTFVQETDKIGLLLMNVRYAAQEDRRFCFELKTVDQTITLQAESLLELKSWLKVFQNETQRITSLGETLEEYKVASSRYPPLITEFASTVDTIIDRQLTNTRIKNDNGQVITSSNLSSRIKSNEKFFQTSLYSRIPSIKPPLITSNTKTAIISYSIAAATALPNALTANTWGSVNWGLYYLQNSLSETDMPQNIYNGGGDPAIPQEPKDANGRLFDIKPGFGYPAEYPESKISLDVEMRALFESGVEPNEICLLSFTCLWSPNSSQELCCRCFITNNNMLLCNQALGFTSLFKTPLSKIMSVNSTIGENYDVLSINAYTDSIKVKIFTEPGKLIEHQLQFIINNRLKDKPEGLSGILNSLATLEREHINNDKSILAVNTLLLKSDTLKVNLPSIVKTDLSNEVQQFTVDYANETPLHSVHEYTIPAKAMFHVLFGDNSTIIQSSTEAEVLEIQKKPWSLAKDGKLTKCLMTTTHRSGVGNNKILVTYKIEKMVEDQYYNITYDRKSFVMFGSRFQVNYRIVIQSVNADMCTVRNYSSTTFDTNIPTNLIARLITNKFQKHELKVRHEKLTEVCKMIGKDAPLARAIYLYGQLTQSSSPLEDEAETPICRFGFRVAAINFCISPLYQVFVTVFKFLMGILDIILGYLKEITAQRLLLAMIVFLTMSNIFFLTRTAKSYWAVRRANQVSETLFNGAPAMLQRAVYLKDLQDITGFAVSDYELAEDSKTLEEFKKKSFIINFGNTVDWKQEYTDISTREFAQGLRKTFQEIGIKRHKLLIEFNLLNQMETEIAKSEWKNWLMSELQKCSYLNDNSLHEILQSNINETDLSEGLDSLKSYCESCSLELSKLNIL